ncbi:L-amino acid N-acyltransferase YncA [Chitinophaga terrae (ex Kim and Jung 2007)]|uniref:L-amino acid N-acyltransferase YncA n=1 Tax=Chitinophaga terrae (ex Kim and Jung 2007) TaxID=408074 RepID=A0A1H4A1W0_9BACT|nr:GNAT family N-acetyltransferase [Chitinophaga terrae (ex Kim and Jung 2007)]GEP90001.1 acetyltransferase [Chitinophaga terrae (ex Kim and Jung 2007)]SEA29897.1 L-amino acid N-acyltransferase YncA [Chitinophaga terrae (ex Kim and Jung 2007)]
MEYTFRKAVPAELGQIWEILEGGIARRKAEGSNQWQDGYPNPDVVRNDIEKGYGYVLADGSTIVGYCAILINDEPAYADIQGKWVTEGDFVVYHRVAVSDQYLGKGLAQVMLKHIEAFARQHHIKSLKADTNFDNAGMLKIFEKLGYVYCGEVVFRGSPRKAFEKVLKD